METLDVGKRSDLFFLMFCIFAQTYLLKRVVQSDFVLISEIFGGLLFLGAIDKFKLLQTLV